MQVYRSQQITPDNPLTYVFFTTNSAHGDNLGLEGELRWQATPRWQFTGAAALQGTRYLGYRLEGAPADGSALDGRAQAFAPAYQLSLAGEYRDPSGWFGRLDLQALDGFYFSASHDQRARARQLANARLGYQRGRWSASLWVRNLLDRRYAVQGFYFGLEPPDYATRLYLQNGDPRQLGVTINADLGGR
jgi:outer membrane receptor protein involved in Fe transport